MSEIQSVFRFAPSPNGLLHLGHALSALLNFREARERHGRFLVRIEDIDPGRTRGTYIDALFDDLAWLGLDWELPVRRQSEHVAFYGQHLEILRQRRLIYPCFCTRRAVQAEAARHVTGKDPDGAPIYAGTCRHLPDAALAEAYSKGSAVAWRLDMAAAQAARRGSPLGWVELESPHARTGQMIAGQPELWGDVILARRDVATSYHLSVVCDDAVQGVTHVVRGQDLFNATSLHRLLQELLELPVPVYHHHRLLKDDQGQKLAKSRGSMSLQAMRAQGMSPSDVFSLLSGEMETGPNSVCAQNPEPP